MSLGCLQPLICCCNCEMLSKMARVVTPAMCAPRMRAAAAATPPVRGCEWRVGHSASGILRRPRLAGGDVNATSAACVRLASRWQNVGCTPVVDATEIVQLGKGVTVHEGIVASRRRSVAFQEAIVETIKSFMRMPAAVPDMTQWDAHDAAQVEWYRTNLTTPTRQTSTARMQSSAARRQTSKARRRTYATQS